MMNHSLSNFYDKPLVSKRRSILQNSKLEIIQMLKDKLL